MALSMGQNVLVDFYAPWCKACVIFAPKYQKAVQEAVKNGLDVTFAKVDTDQNPYLTQRFGVNTFPRLLLFPRSGARPKRYTLFLTSISYRGLRNCFFFTSHLLFPYSFWTFIPLSSLDFYFPILFGLFVSIFLTHSKLD